ncbi:hypothetical protein D8M06_03715 [Oceanobacillus halophilus]|uniref:Uncharacterized protein n=1 Tax=Oceanobacillus halophilus TaxID=930130 RepID=A0A495ADB8_9BACI|nr:hypothetical protein D8M06_03715 [Oceanobacillus halophilus]
MKRFNNRERKSFLFFYFEENIGLKMHFSSEKILILAKFYYSNLHFGDLSVLFLLDNIKDIQMKGDMKCHHKQ